MTHLHRHIVAEMRRLGKCYGALEALLPEMTEPQLRDLLLLMRDSKRDENSRMRSQAARMGFPGVLR